MVRQRLGSLMTVAALFVALLGCNTYSDNLRRGERLFQENKFEDTLALCRLMERDVDALSRTEQARYAFLRGMTDYRLGFRSDARHWLAIAWAIHEQEVGGLDGDQQATAKTTLDELNREVYGLVPIETAAAAGSASSGGSASPGEGTPAGGTGTEAFCRVDADCDASRICVASRCTGR